MRTFAFIPGQVNRAYKGIISRHKEQGTFIELLKVSGLLVFLLVCWFFFLYYVNLASTRGYFLKKENQEMTAINFQHEILKTKLIDHRQQNWGTVQASSFKRDVVDISAEIVKIPNWVQLGFFHNPPTP